MVTAQSASSATWRAIYIYIYIYICVRATKTARIQENAHPRMAAQTELHESATMSCAAKVTCATKVACARKQGRATPSTVHGGKKKRICIYIYISIYIEL